MKKSTLIIIAFYFMAFAGFSQGCLPEGITFSTQQQIDSFQVDYPGCAQIEGDVEISFDVINLNGLSPIESIEGNLIVHNDMMDNLSGLNNLVSIGGNCTISVSYQMTNLTGLDNLKTIGEQFVISDNNSLNSLTGLINLETIGSGLFIINNSNLQNLTGLEQSVLANSTVQVISNNSLVSLSGLDKFITTPIWLRIDDNTSLTSLSGIDSINPELITALSIEFNASLSTCEVQSICDYLASNGAVVIFANAPGCNTPEEVEEACATCLPEGITFTTQQQIDDFQTDYPGCTEIGGDVEIILNPNINNLVNLEVLTSIEGGLEILGTGLTNLDGLHNLTTIGGNLLIWQNNQLTGFESLGNLMSIGGGLEIKYNPQILNLSGFENTSIADYLVITNNIALNSLAALENITSVDGVLLITGNDALQDLSGLNNLNSVEGFLYVDYNASLSNLSGLDNLVSVGEGLEISSNPSLIDLTGLENLTSLGYGLGIIGNPSLASLNGIQNLVSNEGILVLDDNNNLSDITALENIEPGSITDLFIMDNDNLSTCEVQSICDYLVSPNGTITIQNNAPGCNSETEVYNACWVKIDETTAIENHIQIFPNPAKNSITILNSSKTKIQEVIIYSPSGKTILQTENPANTIDISRLQSGLYFVDVKTEMGDVRRKLIVE